jgi:hypothetical protein
LDVRSVTPARLITLRIGGVQVDHVINAVEFPVVLRNLGDGFVTVAVDLGSSAHPGPGAVIESPLVAMMEAAHIEVSIALHGVTLVTLLFGFFYIAILSAEFALKRVYVTVTLDSACMVTAWLVTLSSIWPFFTVVLMFHVQSLSVTLHPLRLNIEDRFLETIFGLMQDLTEGLFRPKTAVPELGSASDQIVT